MNQALSQVGALDLGMTKVGMWRAQIRAGLRIGGAAYIRAIEVGLAGEGVTEDIDAEVKSWLIMKGPPELAEELEALPSAKAVYDFLLGASLTQTTAKKSQMLDQLHKLDFKDHPTIFKLALEARRLQSQLRSVGEEVSTFMVINSVLAALPDAFDTAKTILLNRAGPLTIEEVIDQLTLEEQRLKEAGRLSTELARNLWH